VLHALARVLHERSHLNRFVAGRRIYDRRGVFLTFAATQAFLDDAPLATVKRAFAPNETFAEMAVALDADIQVARSDAISKVDKELSVFLVLPGFLLAAAVAVLRWLDGHGLAPHALIGDDPMSTSAFVANLGSYRARSRQPAQAIANRKPAPGSCGSSRFLAVLVGNDPFPRTLCVARGMRQGQRQPDRCLERADRWLRRGLGTRCQSLPQVIDQQLGACTSPPIAQCTDAFILFNGQSAAQVFMPSNTGTVVHIRLRMNNPAANTNPVQVSIIDLQGDPLALATPTFTADQHVLARVETPMTIVTNWQDVIFPSPAAVTSNQPYAILVRLVGTTDPGPNVHAGWDMYNDFQGTMVDSYPRGRFFDCGGGCPSWTTEPAYRDAAFEVYVSPNVCP
jgi:hypothetical protein